MKCATELKVSPESLRKMQELTPACTIKNKIRKKPVKPIVNFFPIDEVKNCFQVINEYCCDLVLQKYYSKPKLKIYFSFFFDQ